MITLKNITLVGIDCLNIERLCVTAEICQKHIRFGDVRLLTHLPWENTDIVSIPPITTYEQYSVFVIKELYRYIDTEYMLIFQNDGFILNPFAWSPDFLKYDYIGAPWWYNDDCNVGNGGFSLRSRRLMEAVALDDAISEYHPEDDRICRKFGNYLKEKGFTFAPEECARRFSVEGAPWESQFGFHKSDISKWDIRAFADEVRHAKFIDMFYEAFPMDK